MKTILKRIIALICIMAMVVTTNINITPTTVLANDTVSDITITDAIGDYGTVEEYQYRYAWLWNATSEYKYMVITYTGDIAPLRIEGRFKDEYTSDGVFYWMDQLHDTNLTLVGDNPVLSSETKTTVIVDIEASGIDLDKLDGLHMHYGPGTLNIIDFKLSATIPEIPVEDIVFEDVVGTYGTNADSEYVYKEQTFSGAVAKQKYLVVSYIGNVTRCRVGFYNAEGKIGTEMWIDPSQSSSDLSLVYEDTVFESEKEAFVVVDLEASGINAEELVKIRLHSENRALQITGCKLTTSAEIPVDDISVVGAVHDFGAIEEYAYRHASISKASSNHKYMIITYIGDISRLRIQANYKSEYATEESPFYWINQLPLVGEEPVLSSEEVATIVIDLKASGIDLGKWQGMHMHYGPGTLNVGYVRLSSSSEITDVDVMHTRYFKDKAPLNDYAYSFAVVGDTQVVTESDLKYGNNDLGKIYDWILANKQEKKIQYVFGLGDIINNLGDSENCNKEWAYAATQVTKLDGKIPYSVIRGNHDVSGPYFNKGDTKDYFTQYFGTDTYKKQFASGGFFEKDNIYNSWRTFTVGEVDYLLLALDYGPSDDVLAWANNVVKNHPKHNVIITTHAYLNSDGSRLSGSLAGTGGYNNGTDIWNKLVSKHKNIVLLMCGHVTNDKIVVSKEKGINGNIVTTMMINPQHLDGTEGSTGMVAMLYFSADGKNVQVEYYSTVHERYFLEANQFNLELAVVDGTTQEETTTVKPTTTNKIKVNKTKVKTATKKKNSKKVKLSIKKIKGAKGYRVQFSKKKNFAKKNILVTKTVKNAKTTIKNKKFKKAKKLYVRVKAFKMNGKKKVFANKWSNVKRVKIK